MMRPFEPIHATVWREIATFFESLAAPVAEEG
jgi:hypothetical protein